MSSSATVESDESVAFIYDCATLALLSAWAFSSKSLPMARPREAAAGSSPGFEMRWPVLMASCRRCNSSWLEWNCVNSLRCASKLVERVEGMG